MVFKFLYQCQNNFLSIIIGNKYIGIFSIIVLSAFEVQNEKSASFRALILYFIYK